MLVQIRTDNRIQPSAQLRRHIEQSVNAALGRFWERITRVEAYLKDSNSLKGGPGDKECTLEARLKGFQPIAVSHAGPSSQLAVDRAVEKLARAIERVTARSEKPARTPPSSLD